MKDRIERFDMAKPPVPCRWYLRPLLWLLCFPALLMHRTKITKIGMKGLKGPYLLLGNHNAFYDMKVSIAACFPRIPNYIVAIDGYIGREWVLRAIGGICKRKFTNDPSLIRQLRTVVKQGGVIGLYPEARYSLCGTTAPLPESLGKVCKFLKVPVVVLLCHGHHVNHPFWNTRRERKVRPTEATMKLLFTPSDLEELSPSEINDRLVEEFQYDDFRWQKEHLVPVDDPERAVGLEKILYQCPHCGTEFRMRSAGTRLMCDACGSAWEMDRYGQLDEISGAEHGADSALSRHFTHIPDWYEWERENVRREVRDGTYSSGELPVHVDSLPNAKRYLRLGSGTMTHDMDGFHVRVAPDPDVFRAAYGEGSNYSGIELRDGELVMEKPVPSLYSCHVEYEYLFKHGDCVDLNTLTDTWYTYPETQDHGGKPFSVTKMAIATEELYYFYREKIGKPCPRGLA